MWFSASHSWLRFVRIVLRCCAGIICVLMGLLSASAYWYAFPFVISGRYFATYDFGQVVAGGCFDQGGLTKLLIIILVLEMFPVLSWYLCSLISARRKWRIACTVVFLIAFLLPVVLSVMYTWELSRYIAVMGITAKRIVGVRYAILVFFIPAFCAVKWIAGRMAWAKNLRMIGGCLVLAYAIVVGIEAAARRSVASHPRPTRCQPNRYAYVPSKPDAPTDYGLREILFGVRSTSKVRSSKVRPLTNQELGILWYNPPKLNPARALHPRGH